MIRFLKKIPGLVLLVCFATNTQAVLVDDLYVAEVFVTSQDDQQLRAGARAGLLQVLTRVSGQVDVEQNPVIRGAVRNATRYYYQFSYQPTDQTFQIGNTEVAGRILRLSFEPSAIAGLLRDAGYSVWGSNRPGTLVWIVVGDSRDRHLLSEASDNALFLTLGTLTRDRGLPLLYPLYDLEDASRLSIAEIWGGFTDRIDAASVRYGPDVVLTGRMVAASSGQWVGRWSYRIDGAWHGFENRAFDETTLLSELVDQLASALSARYAIDSSRAVVQVEVENVQNLADYAGVLAYFGGLTPVLNSAVNRLVGSRLSLSLSTEGQRQQLVETIELDEKLVLLNPDGVAGPLKFRWLGAE